MMTMQNKKKIFFSAYCLILSVVLIILFLSTLVVILPGCKDNSGDIISQSGSDNVSVGFYSENASGDNTFVITEAKFLLRKLVVDKEGHEEECDVNLGPFVVYLDLTPRVAVITMAKIPAGNYDEIKFQLHKPSPNEHVSDPEFNQGNSNHQRFSVIVRGFYNDLPFMYKSHITVAKEIDFENPPIATVPNTIINITIRLNPYEWFIENGVILDPRDQSNENNIDHNIKKSFKRAFKDVDLNGEPD